ncbi:mitochondrial import inner membrane translocase subunit TIM8-like [Magnolia sinica]|uniref:mitochondrial import inner membrane translocase subunit TIM8-like n=1 Tax=Magnolia sinica TaxID=86752 RepID=UPI00265A1678|nr:mitochondrial import inner membrane translocase subunit TIM8-like [Magnolia sinica]
MDSSSLDTARFQQLLEQEKQRAMLNQMVAKLTNVCWDKCITGSVGNSISHSEATCLSNCAHRFMELSMLTIQRFKSMQ